MAEEPTEAASPKHDEPVAESDSLSVGDPADWQDKRYEVLAYAGGDFGPRNAELNSLFRKPWRTAEDVQSYYGAAALELPLQHRFEELRHLIDESPVANERGWMDLLLDDHVQARRDSARVLAFLEHTPETKWNRWFRLMLRAEAELFDGSGDAAAHTAAEAVALTRAQPDVSNQMDAYVWSTQILAWTKQKDEAVQRLEELSTSIPGLWPGYIPAEPKFSVPLAHDAGYLALTARLTEQMRALALK